MAFGNATKGYVKAHAGGGGGGGTSNYEQLLNKPSINGVELLGDKSIGSLSGNIQVKLSDIANTNLSNVQNAQTLLYNALSQKWENGTPASSFGYTDITSTYANGIDISNINGLMFIIRGTYGITAGIAPKPLILAGAAVSPYQIQVGSPYNSSKDYLILTESLTGNTLTISQQVPDQGTIVAVYTY